MLRDADNDAGFYAAACAADSTALWAQAVLYASSDAGASFQVVATIARESTMGLTSAALGDFHAGNIPDELNAINVVLSHGSLSSTDNTGLLAGTNACVIGEEIIYFRDATLETNGSYTLTGLLRGRRGSEYAMGTHAVGERFVMVDIANLVRVAQDTSGIGIQRLYKAVSVGSTLAVTDAVSFTNVGCGLKPYAPVHLGGGRNADDDVTLTWVRRGRLDGGWRDGVDVPLSEVSESYEVEIFGDGTYATALRTITGITAQTATYSAAEQTTDGLTPGDPVYFRVYQISAVVGRGHAASGVV